jgi:hypothetical protein
LDTDVLDAKNAALLVGNTTLEIAMEILLANCAAFFVSNTSVVSVATLPDRVALVFDP